MAKCPNTTFICKWHIRMKASVVRRLSPVGLCGKWPTEQRALTVVIVERESEKKRTNWTGKQNLCAIIKMKIPFLPSVRPFVHPFWTVHPRLSRVSVSIRLSPFISTSWPEGLKINVCSSCFFCNAIFFSLSLNLLSSNLCVSVYVWSFANMWRCIKSAIKKSLTISAFVVASVVTVGSQNITRVSVCERTIIICWEMIILQLLLAWWACGVSIPSRIFLQSRGGSRVEAEVKLGLLH